MIYLKAALYGLLSVVVVVVVLLAGSLLTFAWYSLQPVESWGARGIGAVSLGVSAPPLPLVLAFVCSFVWTTKNGAAAFTRLGFATLFKAVLCGAVATLLAGIATQYLLGLVLSGFESAQTSRDEVTEVFVSLAFFGLILSLAAYGLGFVWSLKRSRSQLTIHKFQ